jgi:hypothetical protein
MARRYTKAWFEEHGRRGAKKQSQAMTKAERTKRARRAARARWRKEDKS